MWSRAIRITLYASRMWSRSLKRHKLYQRSYSGENVGPLVGVLEAILRYYDRVAGHDTRQLPSTTAKMGHD